MKRTGQSKIAVVGWGRGMGHKGHMYLADAVIQQAKDMNADPYFFVSKTVGKDDPILPEEKVRIYQKVFPQHATIFEPQGNLNQALTDLAGLGYQGVVVVVGADQKEAFQYLVKPNKEGVPVFQTMGLKKLKVISRQETRSQYRGEEGPRATPMREILLDPNATEEDKFKVWRRDMPEQLSDREVLDVMNKAESRMMHQPAKQAKVKQMSQKVAKLKEAIQVLKTKKQSDSEKNSDAMGYKHLFKQPDEEQQPKEKRFHGWAEYEKDKNPEPVEEALIMDRNSKINAYYLAPSGARHKVAEGIPYYLLDKLVDALTKKYAITMKDIEVRPADVNQYRRSSQPELAEEQEVEEAGITRRGILKGLAGAGALGAAGKAGAIAGAFPSPSTREKWAKDAAASNAAEARRQAELKAKADKERLAKNTPDVERLNKVSYHGDNAPQPSNATWDGDSSFLDLDGTQYSMASRMPISGDVPPDMKLISTKEGRQVYIWTRNSLKGVHGRYFYPAANPKTIDETALRDKEDLEAKRKALQDMDREPGHDREAIRQAKLDLEKQAKLKGLSEDYLDE